MLSRPGKPAGGSAAWSDVAVIIPWNMYLSYGDKRILETQYQSMLRWVDYERQRAQNLADANENREHGREPIRFHRHQPVNRCKRHCDRVNHQTRPTQRSHLTRRLERNGRILFRGPFQQLPPHDDPNSKNNCCAENKSRWVQIHLGYPQSFVCRNDSWILPRVQLR